MEQVTSRDKQHFGKNSNGKIGENSKTTARELPMADSHWWLKHRGSVDCEDLGQLCKDILSRRREEICNQHAPTLVICGGSSCEVQTHIKK